MSRPQRVAPARTRADQERASRPDASAWVSANAGSGKTTVLVRRVLRLLLAGVAPGKILCLTFTTAAAANMANRLFDAMAAWVRLDDAALSDALAAVLERAPTGPERNRARTLFAQALETPGGLKIETIHAFCTRLLQTAPFEAAVPAHFAVISQTERASAIEAAIARVLNRASADPALRATLDRLSQEADDQGFRGLIDKALAKKAFLTAPGGGLRPMAEVTADLRHALAVEPAWTPDQVMAHAVAAISRLVSFQDVAAAVSAGGSAKERERWAATMIRVNGSAEAAHRFDVWGDVLLTSKGEPRKDPVTSGALAKDPSLADALGSAQSLMLEARARLFALATFARSEALFALARLILEDYGATKRRLGVLDYDDMITRTRDLFASVEAAWLIYKLDAGLDHLLVDEAQDTSADQWAILDALTAEFFAGHGQRAIALARTVFAVGDEKQSIFGFQGAAPAAFARQRADVQERVGAAGGDFHDVRLGLSFRSTRDVIAAVDAVFAHPDAARGLSHDPAEQRTVHETVRGDDSGAVDLWDLLEPDPVLDEVIWSRPVDAVERQPAVIRLARQIAGTLKRWLAAGTDDLGRPFSAGDVLILLPKRKAAFAAVVRALKDAGVPVAGMDRLKLAEHIAVEDLMALAKAALLPDDDLTIAVVLRSPLFGYDDEDMLRLAPNRPGSLRAALASSADPRDRAADAHLSRIEALARIAGPFAFFSTVLGAMGGRKALLARLGPEAGDAIDAMLVRALEHEREDGLSLAAFIRNLAASDDDVRRDLAAATGQVRVMTVHGAKGLEARVVFIADIAPEPGSREIGPLLEVEAQRPGLSNAPLLVPLWSRGGAPAGSSVERARQAAVDRAIDESRRLLYVAMTRAEDRLILCGVKPAKAKILENAWYGLVERGLGASAPGLTRIPATGDGPGVRRFKVTPPAAPDTGQAAGTGRAAPAAGGGVPPWLLAPLPPEHAPLPPLSPTRLMAAGPSGRVADAASASPLRRMAASRGRLVHQLLQWLPGVEAAQRPVIAARLVARGWPVGAGAPDERAAQEALIGEVLALFADHRLAALLSPAGRSEVDLAGTITTQAGPRAVSGRVDRLLVTPTGVVFADYKTTKAPPRDAGAIPAETLAQMAAYRALLATLYPGRPLAGWLIYTVGPALLAPEPAALDRALSAITGV